jgi:hypothetical protein
LRGFMYERVCECAWREWVYAFMHACLCVCVLVCVCV